MTISESDQLEREWDDASSGNVDEVRVQIQLAQLRALERIDCTMNALIKAIVNQND